MAASFRLPADVVRGWKDALSAKRAVAGVDPVLKEVLDALLKEGDDQAVPVARHQLFSWAQALEGVAARTGDAALRALAADVRSYLGAPAPPTAPAPTVTYVKPAASASASRILPPGEVAGAVGSLVRGARSELVIVAPWTGGLDSIAKDLLALPSGVALRILSRAPAQPDAEYFRVVQELRARRADFVASPALHTRLVVQDGATLLLGAAGAVPGARETPLLTSDPPLAAAARDAALALLAQARGGA